MSFSNIQWSLLCAWNVFLMYCIHLCHHCWFGLMTLLKVVHLIAYWKQSWYPLLNDSFIWSDSMYDFIVSSRPWNTAETSAWFQAREVVMLAWNTRLTESGEHWFQLAAVSRRSLSRVLSLSPDMHALNSSPRTCECSITDLKWTHTSLL